MQFQIEIGRDEAAQIEFEMPATDLESVMPLLQQFVQEEFLRHVTINTVEE